MPWPKPTQIESWSWSRYVLYRRCALAAKLQIIDKIREPPPDPAGPETPMTRGDRIHKAGESFIKGALKKFPEDLLNFSALLRDLKKRFKTQREPITVESTWAFRRDWSVTTFDDWRGCWLRIKVDVAWVDKGRLMICDFKTGKFSDYSADEYTEQLELYALGALIIYADRPGLVVEPALYYTDLGRVHPGDNARKTYTQADLPALKKEWERRVAPMLADKKFSPKPNRLCPWCFYRKANAAAMPGGVARCRF